MASLTTYLKKSLIARLGLLMGLIVFIAVISMFYSIILSESTKGNASAINISGSLRMQSYRIANYLSLYRAGDESFKPHIEKELDEFSRRLSHPNLVYSLPEDTDDPIQQHYHKIVKAWESLKETYTSDAQGWIQEGKYLTDFDQLVGSIDQLVKYLQENTEGKIRLMSFVQGMAMFFSLVMVFITMHQLQLTILTPLKRLITMAAAAGHGDFSNRIPYQSDDELGILAKAFNHMAEDLSLLYGDLENRVAKKTQELKRSNDSLKLLYDASQKVNREAGVKIDFEEVLTRLQEVTQTQSVSLCLTRADKSIAYKTLSSTNAIVPDYCQRGHCETCIYSRQKITEQQITIHGSSYKIMKAKLSYGELFVQHDQHTLLQEWQQNLIQAVSDHIATALSAEEKKEHEHRILLMEERAVIARELHDSLAQSLSYLKMQLGCLQVIVNKPKKDLEDQRKSNKDVKATVKQMREGVDSSYKQLRELLKTFRLKLDEPGLEVALSDTVSEFEKQENLHIELEYYLGHCPLTASEEIHLLQIAREALSNIAQHAYASKASLSLHLNQNNIEIEVHDNGKGFPKNMHKDGHYGTQIMQERAKSLDGELSYGSSHLGGGKVSLLFVPDCLKQDHGLKKIVNQE